MVINFEKYLDQALMWLSFNWLNIVTAIALLIIGKWIAKKISNVVVKVMEKNKVDQTLTGFVKNIVYYILIVIIVIAAAGQLGINTASFLTILGAASLAVGLALKDSLSHFASGVMLILFSPFKVGEVITTNGITGKVESINIFNTLLTTPDNRNVIIPNSAITSGTITNITANPTRRVDMVIGIGYSDSIEKADSILRALLEEDARILPDPAPYIAVSELADSSVNFVVRPWVKTEDYWGVLHDMTRRIKLAFDKEGISIPYPQQDVHVFTQATGTHN